MSVTDSLQYSVTVAYSRHIKVDVLYMYMYMLKFSVHIHVHVDVCTVCMYTHMVYILQWTCSYLSTITPS